MSLRGEDRWSYTHLAFDARFVETPAGRFRTTTLGSGREILVLHTLRNQLEYSHLIAPALAADNTVRLLDLPGHGGSSKDLTRPFDAERFSGDVAAFVVASDLADLTIVGESIGATIALVLAARMPDRVRRVVAFNPHDRVPALGGRRGGLLARAGRHTSIPFRLENRTILRAILADAFVDPSRLPDDYLSLLVEAGRDPAYPAVMHSVLKNARSWPAVRDDYRRIPADLPVTLVYGSHDWASPEHRSAVAGSIPSVDDVVTLADTGHWSFLERPDQVARVVQGARP